MIDPKDFLHILQNEEISFFAGVPDSLLKNFCKCADDVLNPKQHIITANEGGAISVATGYYLSTNKVPLVYMQNSGLGNAINPLVSLVDTSVYSVPMLLVIGWRGEPGVSDEPQHVKQGPITPKLLEAMDIPYVVLSNSSDDYKQEVVTAIEYAKESKSPYAILVKKGTFTLFESNKNTVLPTNANLMLREDVLTEVINTFPKETIYIGTTGKLSRELFELREKRNESHERDFLTVGSMGHASQIALGISENIKDKMIVCLDGDGAALMHLGGLATIGARKPNNFIHIIFNNGVHESVGGQEVTGNNVDYTSLAKSVGYADSCIVSGKKELQDILQNISRYNFPLLIDCIIKPGSRDDLGRPTITPKENTLIFMEYLKST